LAMSSFFAWKRRRDGARSSTAEARSGLVEAKINDAPATSAEATPPVEVELREGGRRVWCCGGKVANNLASTNPVPPPDAKPGDATPPTPANRRFKIPSSDATYHPASAFCTARCGSRIALVRRRIRY